MLVSVRSRKQCGGNGTSFGYVVHAHMTKAAVHLLSLYHVCSVGKRSARVSRQPYNQWKRTCFFSPFFPSFFLRINIFKTIPGYGFENVNFQNHSFNKNVCWFLCSFEKAVWWKRNKSCTCSHDKDCGPPVESLPRCSVRKRSREFLYSHLIKA